MHCIAGKQAYNTFIHTALHCVGYLTAELTVRHPQCLCAVRGSAGWLLMHTQCEAHGCTRYPHLLHAEQGLLARSDGTAVSGGSCCRRIWQLLHSGWVSVGALKYNHATVAADCFGKSFQGSEQLTIRFPPDSHSALQASRVRI